MFHPNNTTSIQYRQGAAIKDASFRACSFLNGLGHGPVYEVLAGPPSWTSLYRHVAEYVAQMADKAIVDAIKSLGRSTPEVNPPFFVIKTRGGYKTGFNFVECPRRSQIFHGPT